MADNIEVNNTNPQPGPERTTVVEREDSGSWAIALIILAILVLFLIFGLPALRGTTDEGTDIDVDIPPIETDENVGGVDLSGDGLPEDGGPSGGDAGNRGPGSN